MTKILALATVILLMNLGACGNSMEYIGDEAANFVEDESMMFKRMTKEEFAQMLNERDISLTLDDFEGIDIEDFIQEGIITVGLADAPDSEIQQYLETALESYKRNAELKEKANYMAREIISIESTDEEYAMFLEEFFAAIDKELPIPFNKQSGFDLFRIEEEKVIDLYIAQTMYIQEMDIYNNPNRHEELLEVFISSDSGSVGISGNFCYNKTKKFMMLTNIQDDYLFEYAKIFCGI